MQREAFILSSKCTPTLLIIFSNTVTAVQLFEVDNTIISIRK